MSKLLKEAIADAKAVKETALKNAKLALEEAFTPRLQSMLSAKISEEMEDEEYESEDEFSEDEMEDEVEVEAPVEEEEEFSMDAEPEMEESKSRTMRLLFSMFSLIAIILCSNLLISGITLPYSSLKSS